MTVMNCQVSGQNNVSLYVAQGAAMHLFNCVVENTNACLSAYGVLTGSGNIFAGGVAGTIGTSHSASWAFHDNHILNAGGYTITGQSGTPGTPVVFDFSNNFWGTTDPAQIAAWINDNVDSSGIKFLIDFDPFHADPVSTQVKSFGQLRAMFGGN